MPRQRFLWPSFWDDPVLGRLPSDHRLLFLSCISFADDDGKILGDPAYLKSQAFRYHRVSVERVRKMRDELAASLRSFHVYEVDGAEFILLRKWREYQKPKYPTPSKFPDPSPTDSGNVSGNLSPTESPTESGNVSATGWVGLGRVGIEASKEAVVNGKIPLTQIQLVYDHWRTARGKTDARYEKISVERKRKLQTRLREFTPEQLIQAIDAVALDPWEDRPRHDDITKLFLSREKVDDWLELADKGVASTAHMTKEQRGEDYYKRLRARMAERGER